jgi:hypothetical protein
MADTGWKYARSYSESGTGESWINPENIISADSNVVSSSTPESESSRWHFSSPTFDLFLPYYNYNNATTYSAYATPIFLDSQFDTSFTEISLKQGVVWKPIPFARAVVNNSTFGCNLKVYCNWGSGSFYTKSLIATNFGFEVPVGNDINYVEFKITGKVNDSSISFLTLKNLMCKVHYTPHLLGINF